MYYLYVSANKIYLEALCRSPKSGSIAETTTPCKLPLESYTPRDIPRVSYRRIFYKRVSHRRAFPRHVFYKFEMQDAVVHLIHNKQAPTDK